jgi:hypothetical protein
MEFAALLTQAAEMTHDQGGAWGNLATVQARSFGEASAPG